MLIKQAQTKKDIEDARRLFRKYEAYLDVDLCFQSFEKELEDLPGKYSYPEGDLLLADYNGKVAGCVAVRGLDKNVCEMKRLFVIPQAME